MLSYVEGVGYMNPETQAIIRSPKIEIFDRTLTPISSLDRFDSLQWVEKPNSAGWFELWCPLDAENAEILRPDNILWQGDTSAAYIESIKKEMTQNRGLQLQVRGKMIENYLASRIVWGQYIKSGAVSAIMCDMVVQNAISPSNINRKIPMLQLSPQQQDIGESISFQNTGGNLHDVLEALCETYNIGWEIWIDPFEKTLTFIVVRGIDRTLGNSDGNDPIVFDSDMEDILASSYFYNKNGLRNVALVSGSGQGAERKTVTINNSIGLDRHELFVDARDLSDIDENMNPIPESTYNEMLTARGRSKLEEWPIVETFNADLRVQGNVQYQYGYEYLKGDWVTIQDRGMDIEISAKVTEAQKIYDSKGFNMNITFGYTQPTLNKIINNMKLP